MRQRHVAATGVDQGGPPAVSYWLRQYGTLLEYAQPLAMQTS
jgi:hypothetical protein